MSKIAPEVGIGRSTIKRHLDIFAQNQLLASLTKFDKKKRREVKSTKKYYVTSPSLMYTMTFREDTKDSAFLGHAAETYAYQRLKSLVNARIYVEKGALSGEEVDFYLPDKNTLIECKYSRRFREREFDYLLRRVTALKAKATIFSRQAQLNERFLTIPLACLLSRSCAQPSQNSKSHNLERASSSGL